MANHTNHHAADLIGRDFGRLVVVSRAGSRNGEATWFCRCECLGSKVTTTHNLLSGNVRSCGCLQREHAKRQGSRVMDTHPRWRGKILPLPHYEDDPAAVADHSPCRVPWERYDIVFRPARKLLSRPRGRPRLPEEEVARREAARLPRGRPCQDPGRQVMRECLWRIAEAARAAGIDPVGIVKAGPRQLQSGSAEPDCDKAAVPALPEPVTSPPQIEPTVPLHRNCRKILHKRQREAWNHLTWSERKAAIWERARRAA